MAYRVDAIVVHQMVVGGGIEDYEVGELADLERSEYFRLAQARYSIQRTAAPRMAKDESTTASPRISVLR